MMTHCLQCVDGYKVFENKCILEGEVKQCETDFDCTDVEHCLLNKCHSFTENETKCYRTEDCAVDGTVCGKPGLTNKNSCGKCTNFA